MMRLPTPTEATNAAWERGAICEELSAMHRQLADGKRIHPLALLRCILQLRLLDAPYFLADESAADGNVVDIATLRAERRKQMNHTP